MPQKTISLMLILAWLLFNAAAAFSGFYLNTHTLPPRLVLALAPPVILILFLLFRGNQLLLNTINLQQMVLLSVIRIPVEIVLFELATAKVIPGLMTFKGINFDIISGITAPVIYFVCFKSGQVIRKSLLAVWNLVCLGLLLNVVVHGVLSVPFSFQRYGFEQPNIAVLYFPYVWLPCAVVPMVLFSHLVILKRLADKKI